MLLAPLLSGSTQSFQAEERTCSGAIQPGSPVGQLRSHVPLGGHMTGPVISDLRTRSHLSHNDDLHFGEDMFPKPCLLALNSFNLHALELVASP